MPNRGTHCLVYGHLLRLINRLGTGICAVMLLTAAAPRKGEPPLTAQTQRSGGVIDVDQAKLTFDSADLSFEIFPDREAIAGIATLTFTAKEPLARLVIDLDRNLPVSAIQVEGVALRPGTWSNPQGKLTIPLPRPLAKGDRVTARISYRGTPHVAVRAPWDDGFVWAKTKDGKPWVATTAEGYGCDLFWPCLDFPTGEPGRVDLHIKVPKGLSAPSNGILLGVDRHRDGRSTWNWRIKHPNTYGIALNIGPYQQITGSYKSRFGNSIPMFYWHLPGAKDKALALFAEFAPTLDFFESVIGPYPFGDEKLGVVETPHLGMEHQTINAYGNGYAKAAEGFDWLFQHELSHEWFGNQLTVANWDDYWLHEGFGSYMQPLYGRWREGEARYAAMLDLTRAKIINAAPVVSGTIRTEEEVYEDKSGGPGGDIYSKGSWTLHTLRWLIGDKPFFDATRRLVYGRPDPKPGNFVPRYGSTAEFEALVNEVTGKNYTWFFNAYLRQAALPELITSTQRGVMMLEWKSASGPFPMPVDVQIDDQITRVEMPDGKGSLPIPDGAHIVIDPFARILKRSRAIEEMHSFQQLRLGG